MKRVGMLALGIFLMAATHVEAVPTWTEAADAGDLPSTAQAVTLAGFNQISGEITNNDDVDMFQFVITKPLTFSATTSGPLDSQLFLFNASGQGIAANDDISNSDTHSQLPAGYSLYNALAPGVYYLAISGFNRDPSSAGGPIFPGASFTAVEGPTDPAAVISGWQNGAGSNETGTYTITLTSVAAVPEPGSLLGDVLMLGPVLLGMANIPRWKKKK